MDCADCGNPGGDLGDDDYYCGQIAQFSYYRAGADNNGVGGGLVSATLHHITLHGRQLAALWDDGHATVIEMDAGQLRQMATAFNSAADHLDKHEEN